MRTLSYLVLGLLPMAGWAQAPVPPTPAPAQAPAAGEDPLLASLIQDALARNPDLAQGRQLANADRERIPQAGALPDPSLTLGIQNDGFHKIQVGQMETSYYEVMVTQPLYWPGKRDLRTQVARMGAQETEVALDRTRLTIEADVRRSYTGLLLAQGQLKLLDDQALFLQQAEATARGRYEVGQAGQADLLRAQLERTRLDQTRFQLQAAAKVRVGELNRLRGMNPDMPLAVTRTLDQLPDPRPAAPDFQAQAEAKSPELRSAQLGIQQAQRSLELARLDRHPDFSVSAGVMPRGALEPMWTASVGITLPVWQKSKQQRAVAEQEYREGASSQAAEQVRCLLEQRIQERSADLDSALRVIGLYRQGLLVQSEASFRATLSQYTVGKVPFVSVLEALDGWIADQSGLLQAQAQAQAIAIAQDELNLGATPEIGAPTVPAASMGSAGAKGGATASAAKGGAPGGSGDGEGSSSMSSM